jgi:DNA topoisomerase-1
VIERTQEQEQWRAQLDLPRATKWLSRTERGLIALLEASGNAAELLND